MPIGSRIRILLAARGVTGRQLAENSGLSPQTISRIIQDHHAPNYRTLERISAALGVTPGYLLGPELERLGAPACAAMAEKEVV